jgi:hypothetical protein
MTWVSIEEEWRAFATASWNRYRVKTGKQMPGGFYKEVPR